MGFVSRVVEFLSGRSPKEQARVRTFTSRRT